MQEIRFDDQVVIITGAGAGLGRQYALEFARRGAIVVVNDLGAAVDGTGAASAAADGVVDEIRRSGGRATASYASVTTEDSAQSIVDLALSEYERVDVLVNNAGILRDRSLHNMTTAEWGAVLDVHLNGAFHMTRAAFPPMRAAGYGRVVFAASNAGLFGNFGQANYGAAKAALLGLSRVLSIEGAKYGVASNVIAPVARTRMTEDVLGEYVDKLGPEAVVPMVVYLASRECGRTGRVYSAAGGRYAEVFTALTPGWTSVGGDAAAEDIQRHLGDIERNDGYILPRSVYDELSQIKEALSLR
jgi:NAD(P)-dependent dehydrogenase (short-subunit alcohol dehydrogenase family)